MSDAPFLAAQQLLIFGRAKEALERIEKDFDVTDPWHWWLRATALVELDRHDEALDAVAEGLGLEPESTMLLRVLARAHLDLDHLAAAEMAVLSALRLDPEDADLLALYALIVAKANQLDKAEKLIARARRSDPENATALRIEAALAIARGKHDLALLRTRELLAIDPEDAHAHALAGSVLHQRGDVDAAAPYLRTAVVNDPGEQGYGEIARHNLYLQHWLMFPLRPIYRFGPAPVWLTGVALIFLLPDPFGNWFAFFWLFYCIYSWVMPAIVKRIVR
ncbi:MAG TPA: tetratricopeptide repeat protein [Thermoanaerobaculia bacterium]